MGLDIYDREGNPISEERWSELHRDIMYKTVRRSKFMLGHPDEFEVSTVWLGLNHNFGDEELAIFETMVFGIKSDEYEYQVRYATEEAAIAGHQAAIDYAFDKLGIINVVEPIGEIE